ncbi:MAG: (Fe-S)-binding protein [Archaeoglobaceae archaeon]
MKNGKDRTKVEDISKEGQMVDLKIEDLMPLPYPYDKPDSEPELTEPKEEWKERYITDLDKYIGLNVPFKKPETKEEEDRLVQKFLKGLEKLLNKEDHWTFLEPLLLTLDYCAKCQTCSEACPIYVASGRKEIYRPTYRSEVLRRIYKKYFTRTGKLLGNFVSGDIDLNWRTIARLAELSYRCTLCRRCTQTCPIGVDNGLITRELRLLFSQEMGIANRELHELGTVQQLEVGSSTAMTPDGFMNIVEFMEEEIEEFTGKKIKIPVDEKGADYLLIHNAGEFLSWPENPEAFAILFDEADVSYTLSSELVAYDAVNYGVWYDDMQLARVAAKHSEIAQKLDANSIMVGECGHAHKAISVVADRVLADDYNIPRGSCMPILWDMVKKKKLNLDPEKNDFPVTLHDPCNMVRLMGVVEPQRKVLRAIAPQFREMEPHGVYNYCCGGGSGFAIMSSINFPEWRDAVAARMKFKQTLDAFQDSIEPSTYKYLCAPCSNCKGGIREFLSRFDAPKKAGIYYGGLVELMVNAMVDLEEPFLEEEFH